MNYDTLDRDIFASLGVYFQTVFAGYLPVFFEDEHIDGAPSLDYIEVRIEGSNIDEIAHEQYQVTAEVDIKIVRQKTKNIFTIRENAGKCAEALRQDILLTHQDSGVSLGCMSTQSFYGRRSKINTHHYKQLKNKHILVATVATKLSILL